MTEPEQENQPRTPEAEDAPYNEAAEPQTPGLR